jgi:hypothetical protein
VQQSLSVDSVGNGAIEVPSGDFGNGWCLVVYTNQALTRVLTFRPV